jgi:serine protease Do
MNLKFLSRILLVALGIDVILALPVSAKDKPESHPALKLVTDSNPVDPNAMLRASYAEVIKNASQSVVYIATSKKVHTNTEPMLNDPVFRHFFGTPGGPNLGIPQNQLQESLGSGIIVSANGYIITNNHVVNGADDIKIKFGKPEKEYKATLIGKDEEADIAILKIDAKDLIPAKLADSDIVQVGDTVLAIGNPFGIGLTVTHGIVSALGRNNLNIEAFEDFIQTDASINPGNSGGALLDLKGRVIGVNTAIMSNSGGSNGVGFAIPVNLVKSVVEQLVAHGKVSRGFMGVSLQELKPDLAEQFGTTRGALIGGTTVGAPADKAGLKSGDVITKLNGKMVDDPAQLRMSISQIAPGTEVKVEYLREGKTYNTIVALGDRATNMPQSQTGNATGGANDDGVLNGVTVGELTKELRDQLNVPSNINGALITDVDPSSASAHAGLQKGDIILDLDKHIIHNADDAVKLSESIKGPKVLVRYWRSGASRFVVVDETPRDK